jgi:glutamate synthase (NADPH) large chain
MEYEYLLISCQGSASLHGYASGRQDAQQVPTQWDVEIGRFWQVVPKEMLARLAQPLSDIAAKIPAE